jgi:hypothetical protein
MIDIPSAVMGALFAFILMGIVVVLACMKKFGDDEEAESKLVWHEGQWRTKNVKDSRRA